MFSLFCWFILFPTVRNIFKMALSCFILWLEIKINHKALFSF